MKKWKQKFDALLAADKKDMFVHWQALEAVMKTWQVENSSVPEAEWDNAIEDEVIIPTLQALSLENKNFMLFCLMKFWAQMP